AGPGREPSGSRRGNWSPCCWHIAERWIDALPRDIVKLCGLARAASHHAVRRCARLCPDWLRRRVTYGHRGEPYTSGRFVGGPVRVGATAAERTQRCSPESGRSAASDG